MQVYLPKVVTITGTDNLPSDFKTIPDATMTTLAAQTKVVFDTSERYQISYTTLPLLESVGGYKRYRLLLQKQLCTPADAPPLKLTLPPPAPFSSATPTPP